MSLFCAFLIAKNRIKLHRFSQEALFSLQKNFFTQKFIKSTLNLDILTVNYVKNIIIQIHSVARLCPTLYYELRQARLY